MIDRPHTKGFLQLPHIYEDPKRSQAYKTRWSLRPLLEKNKALLPSERDFLKEIDKEFSRGVDEHDPSISPLREADIAKLTRFFFPPFQKQNGFGVLLKPMFMGQALISAEGQERLQHGYVDNDAHDSKTSATITAGMFILSEVYGQQLPHLRSAEIDFKDERTGLSTHFVIIPGLEYARVIVHGEKPELSRAQVRELLANPDDVDLWLSTLPVETFSFEGIEINQAVDLTPQISQNRLQRLLLKREAVLSERRIKELATVLSNLLGVSDLELGIHAIDYPLKFAVGHKRLVRQDLLADRIPDFLDPALGETIYTSTCKAGTVKIFDDLEDCLAEADPLLDSFLGRGYKSLVLVPLFSKQDHIAGMMQLASKRSFAFSSLVITQMEAVIPLFRQALNRTRGDMEFRIQSVMRQTFTDLDPRVEWRFIKAAASLIEQQGSGATELPSIDPIRFQDVWALYGQADIVGSSKLRNEAIRKDMVAELSAAIRLLQAPAIALLFPLAGKLAFDGEKLLLNLSGGMSPNDEQEVQRFLEVEFKPMLKQLSSTKEAKQRVETYQRELAKSLENDMTHREAYEKSVSKLSRAISDAITSSEEDAQRIIPHYFSKYRTDGIEFNIYAGQSLLPSGTFTDVHLQNLRLWQLQALINVTKSVAGLQDSLPMKMMTAQLIFAFGQPITIQFRMDEKRFDVEGAYNVRYEVIKKRIDKALVLGTEERLTQPNHLAVVYTHVTDRKVYLDLLQYLSESKQVAGPVEELELEPMQGVDGLMALRVKVL